MTVRKMSIAMPADLRDEVRTAADRSGESVSAWISEAAASRLRNEGLGAFLEEWEREHGAFTEEEIQEAEIRLGLRTARE